MKCLSVMQPWASLIVTGEKKIETRSWSTNYRGWLLIHASRKWEKEQKDLCLQEPFFTSLLNHFKNGVSPILGTCGCIIGAVKLTDCHLTNAYCTQDAKELRFGDFSQGRYEWRLEQPHPLAVPVRHKGNVGLFEVENECISELLPKLAGLDLRQPISKSV
jgi:hypothetical protein